MIRILLPLLLAASRAQAWWKARGSSRRAFTIVTAAAGVGVGEAPVHLLALIRWFAQYGNGGASAPNNSKARCQPGFATVRVR